MIDHLQMNFYKIIQLSKRIKSANVKLLGVYVLYLLKKRHLSIRIDPSLNCNLFCKMCYFSSMEQRKKLKGIIPQQDFAHIARVLFPKAIQVYIGCGAEPTTHRNFLDLAQLAYEYKVPNIGLVTNGQLLTEKQMELMTNIGLNEITLSCHGVYKENYEFFMTNSKYDRFLDTLELINKYKFKSETNLPEIRINYTVNNKNLSELKDFFKVFEEYNVSTLQVRPVLNIGGKYSNAISDEQIQEYDYTINLLKEQCKKNNVRLLANTTDIKFEKKNTNRKAADAVYTYIGPKTTETLKADWENLNFKEYIKRSGWKKKVWNLLTNNQKSAVNKSTSYYEVFE